MKMIEQIKLNLHSRHRKNWVGQYKTVSEMAGRLLEIEPPLLREKFLVVYTF